MARRDEPRPNKSKVMVMLFQVEGDDQTIQEGFKTISQAMGNVFRPARPDYTPALPGGNSNGEPKRVASAEPKEATGELFPEADEEAVNPPVRTRARGARTVKQLDILDLDLEQGGDSLKKFCDEHSVDGNSAHSRRYLAIAVWLKEKLGVSAISDHYVHTCYRKLGWHTPPDPTSPLRAMKGQNKWFNKGEERGTYAINHIGEGEFAKMKN